MYESTHVWEVNGDTLIVARTIEEAISLYKEVMSCTGDSRWEIEGINVVRSRSGNIRAYIRPIVR